MIKRIKWTKMYIAILLLSVGFAVLLFGRTAAVKTQSAPWTVTAQREAQPVEVHRVNINTADSAELILLPGIGEKLARRIIAYREENGSLAAPEELLQVSGIGEATLENFRAYITFEEVQP